MRYLLIGLCVLLVGCYEPVQRNETDDQSSLLGYDELVAEYGPIWVELHLPENIYAYGEPEEPISLCTKEAEHSRILKLLVEGYLELAEPRFAMRGFKSAIEGDMIAAYYVRVDGVLIEVTESGYDVANECLDKLKTERIAELRKYLEVE